MSKDELKREISLTPIETERPLLSYAQYEENKMNGRLLLVDKTEDEEKQTAQNKEEIKENQVEKEKTEKKKTTEKKTEEKKIEKKKSVFKIASSLVAIVVLILIILLNVDPAKNILLKNMGTPSQYYHYIERKNSERISEKVAALYTNVFLKYVDSLNQPTTGTVGVEMEEEGRHLLEAYTSQIPFLGLDDLSFISNWQIDFEKNLTEEGFITKSNVTCGENSLFHLDYVYLKNYENTAISVEEMSPYYIWMKKNVTKNKMYDAKIEFATELGEELPSGFIVEKGLTRYISILSDEANNVNKQQDSLSIGSMIVPCTKLSYNVDYEMMKRITASLADTMEKDRNFLSVYECFGRIAKDRNYATMDTGFDNALKYMREKNAEYTKLANENNILLYTVNTWVDDNGNMIGREIVKYEDGKESKWICYDVEMKHETGFYAELQTEKRQVKIESSGNQDNQYWNGDVTVTESNDVVATIKVDRFNTKAWLEGIMDGNAQVCIGSRKPIILDKYPVLSFIDEMPECIIKLNFHDTEEENQVDMKFIANQKSWINASYFSKKGEKKKTELPKVSEIIDMTKLADLKKLKDSLDISQIYENLEKVGFEKKKSLLDFF